MRGKRVCEYVRVQSCVCCSGCQVVCVSVHVSTVCSRVSVFACLAVCVCVHENVHACLSGTEGGGW